MKQGMLPSERGEAAVTVGEREVDGTHRTAAPLSRSTIVARNAGANADSPKGGELFQRRLSVFYGYIALLSTLATATGYVLFDGRAFEAMRGFQTLHAGLLVGAFVTLRLRVWHPYVLRALDLGATAITAGTAALVLCEVPHVETADVSAVAFFVLFFVVRAALVPSQPWLASGIAAACAVPFALGIAVMYQRAGAAAVPNPDAAAFGALRSMLAGVVAVHIVSHTIYGLRRAVEKAEQLGQYVIHERIGGGGMGTVYRASHALLKRPTAVKVIAADHTSEAATERFEREVLATSRLSHPNTIAVYDFGRTQEGVFYYAMELLDGVDLARLVQRDGPRTAEQTTRIVRQVAGALSEAHDAELVHRDIKPENIMLCARGGVQDFVKVLDFGLVKDVTANARLTGEHAITGTPLFMAPESILTPESVGPPADVYGLGCVAYFLLSGRPPFEGANIVQVCSGHIHSAPEPVSSLVPNVPPALDALILSCLAKDPAARPSSRKLEELLGEGAEAASGWREPREPRCVP